MDLSEDRIEKEKQDVGVSFNTKYKDNFFTKLYSERDAICYIR